MTERGGGGEQFLVYLQLERLLNRFGKYCIMRNGSVEQHDIFVTQIYKVELTLLSVTGPVNVQEEIFF